MTAASALQATAPADALAHQRFAEDILHGLSARRKQLSPKYFYDARGSELFEQITRLPEYYPTRTELGILRDNATAIRALIPQNAALVEFGAGSTTKARILLEQGTFGAYVPVDISADFLLAQARELHRDFPDLPVYPLAADFTSHFELPSVVQRMAKVGFFPGSTIGNFEPEQALGFLQMARRILGADGWMIIGVDLEKSEHILCAAYNDAQGTTARFNLNLLARINRELGGNFDLSAFRHRAIYNRQHHRIEMHLVSQRDQTIRLLGRDLHFCANESIHTESSYKYSIERFKTLAKGSGWQAVTSWTDTAATFSVHAFRAEVAAGTDTKTDIRTNTRSVD